MGKKATSSDISLSPCCDSTGSSLIMKLFFYTYINAAIQFPGIQSDGTWRRQSSGFRSPPWVLCLLCIIGLWEGCSYFVLNSKFIRLGTCNFFFSLDAPLFDSMLKVIPVFWLFGSFSIVSVFIAIICGRAQVHWLCFDADINYDCWCVVFLK